jgi:hypothetical protein
MMLPLAAAVLILGACAASNSSSDGNAGPGTSGAPARYGTVPPKAERVAEGTGRLSFRASEEGRLWVGDEARRQELLACRVIPEGGRIELNGQALSGVDLEQANPHAVYFLRSGIWDGANGGDIKPYDGIPEIAWSVATGYGLVEWRADRSGRVWVGNDTLKRMIVSSTVRAGDVVEVDTRRDQVKVNGQVVFDRNLESKDQHSVFFR